MQVVGHASEVVYNWLPINAVAARNFAAEFARQYRQNRRAKTARGCRGFMAPFGRANVPQIPALTRPGYDCPVALLVRAGRSSPAQLIACRAGSKRSVAIIIARSICSSSIFAAESFAGVSSQYPCSPGSE
jgi:hypothetical protein